MPILVFLSLILVFLNDEVVLNVSKQAQVRAGVHVTERNKIFGIENNGKHKLPTDNVWTSLWKLFHKQPLPFLKSLSHSPGVWWETDPHRDVWIQFFESSRREAGGARHRSTNLTWQRGSVSQAAGGATWAQCSVHVHHPRCRSLHQWDARQTAPIRRVTTYVQHQSKRSDSAFQITDVQNVRV